MSAAQDTNHWPMPRPGFFSIYDLQISRGAAKGIRVPLWVPRKLIAEYVECAAEYGEEHAAAHVRKVKRELHL